MSHFQIWFDSPWHTNKVCMYLCWLLYLGLENQFVSFTKRLFIQSPLEELWPPRCYTPRFEEKCTFLLSINESLQLIPKCVWMEMKHLAARQFGSGLGLACSPVLNLFFMERTFASCGPDWPRLDESESLGWGQGIDNNFDYDSVLVTVLLQWRDTVTVAALMKESI